MLSVNVSSINFFALILALVIGLKLQLSLAETKNLRGLVDPSQEHCNPRKYFSNAGSLLPRKSFQIVTPGRPPYYAANQTFAGSTTHSISGDKKGYPEELFQSRRYTFSSKMTYIFDSCNDGQEYKITLGFADIFISCGVTGVPTQIFDIRVNGQVLIENLDIVKDVGCFTAYVTSGNFYPIDNKIEIEIEEITRDKWGPYVNFVEVDPVIPDSRRHLNECETP